MKILQLGKFYPYIGGVNKVLFDLASGISEKFKYQCDILCVCADGNKRIIENNKFSKTYALKSLGGMISSTFISIEMILWLRKDHKNYDIIHVHHPDPMAFLALFLSVPKAKVVLHWHSDIIRQKSLLKLFYPLQKWVIKRANVIIATTPNYARGSRAINKYLYKIKILPIGIRKEDLPTKITLVNELKEKYKYKKIILSIGRLCYYKGFEHLIESANYLSNDYVVLIGGSGNFKKKLSRLIEKNKLSKKVYLLGKIANEEMGSYYEACDLFCLSSTEKSEAFGIVQIEAMSFGKPVIATKIPDSGVSWVNSHNESGLNVGHRKSEEIADAIKMICENPILYSKLSKGAFNRYSNNFTYDKMINDCINIYKSIL